MTRGGRIAVGPVAVDAGLLMLSFAIGVAYAMARGADIMWDLRNYHLYNAFAFVEHRLDIDIAPVGLHTFINPLADLPFYWLLTHLGAVAAHIFLGLCYGGLIFVVLQLNRRIFAVPALSGTLPRPVGMVVLPICATLIGVTGAAALGQAATTTNEVQIALLVLVAILLILPPGEDAEGSVPRFLVAGLCLGAAVGLKFTAGTYLVAVTALLPWPGRAGAVRRIATFAAAVAVGIAATYAMWGWTLYAKFGNPLFPFFNDMFRSPWAAPRDFVDTRFLPPTLLDALVYPVRWAFAATNVSSELFTRDPRLLLLTATFILLPIAALATGRAGRAVRRLLLFALIAYGLWLWRFGILRYAIPLEVAAGTLLVALIAIVARSTKIRGTLTPVAAAAAAIILLVYPVRPDWGRIPFAEAYRVSMAPVPDGSLVLLVGQPIAYVATAMPGRNLRFAGLIAWFREGLLADAVRSALDANEGRSWAVLRQDGASASLLADIGWQTVDARCSPVTSAIDPVGLALCPLERRPAAG